MLVDADVMKMLRLKEGRFLDWPSWEATISSMERMLRFFRTCSASARPGIYPILSLNIINMLIRCNFGIQIGIIINNIYIIISESDRL